MNIRITTLSFIAIFTVSTAVAEDQFTDVPLTGEDIKQILDLDVRKVKIDFEKTGIPTLEVKALGGDDTVTLPVPGKSATLITRIKRGDDGLSKVYYWFSSNGHTTHSSFYFKEDDAVFTHSGKVDGVYTITAQATRVLTSKVGYSLMVTSGG